MIHKKGTIKTGLNILTALLLLGLILGYLPVNPVVADSLPNEEIASTPEMIVPDAIIIKFEQGIDLPPAAEEVIMGIPSIDALINRFEVRHVGKLFANSKRPTDPKKIDLSRFYRVEFPIKFSVQEVSDAFLQNPFVESVEAIGIHPVLPTHPDDTFYTSPNYYQWNFHNTGQTIQGNVGTVDADVDAPEAWDLTTGNSSVKLAIVDTGIDWQHPDLASSSPYISGNVWINSAEYYGTTLVDDDGNGYVDDYRGWDWVDGVTGVVLGEDANTEDNDPMDFNGHGTHCAGIASAITDNGTGVAGLGWSCQVMALRAGWESATGYGYVRMDFCAQAINYATEMGATAINCSWGSSNSGGIAAAVQNAVDNGVLVVVAAGNDNSESQGSNYLSTRGDCIDVAATNNNDVRYSGSNYGTWVDVSAPGENIGSTYPDNNYVWMTGTSMAAPHVVGLCGLLKSLYPEITAREIKQRIFHTTDNIDTINPTYAGKLGSGRINAYNALTLHWSSYSNSGHTIPCEDFNVYPDENTVYMYGAKFLADHPYRVAYYDGSSSNNNIATYNMYSDSDGNLESLYTISQANNFDNPWHVIVCEQTQDPPSTYDADWEYNILDDSFIVQSSAIPEFPAVLATIAVIGLSAGIYFWMRRKYIIKVA